MADYGLNYEQGRFDAISDLLRWFERHSDTIKLYKLNNYGGIAAVLRCLAENWREFADLRDNIEFVVSRGKKNKPVLEVLKEGR